MRSASVVRSTKELCDISSERVAMAISAKAPSSIFLLNPLIFAILILMQRVLLLCKTRLSVSTLSSSVSSSVIALYDSNVKRIFASSASASVVFMQYTLSPSRR